MSLLRELAAEPAGDSETRRRPGVARLASTVLLVCAGYYAGGLVGIWLRFPPSGIATIWPSTAILLAALLLAPTRAWWVYLLAAVPTHWHLVANFQPEVPLIVMLCQVGINDVHAVLAALAVRGASVLGDPVQLRQVLLNVVLNACEAVEATPVGPRAILIEAGQPDRGRLAIAVRDSGIGVKESELERIFKHFVTSKPQGLGMGLAISRTIVEAHGGRIWATANADMGLTVHIELPVDQPSPESPPRRAWPAA